jgi:ribonuclease HI
VKAVLHVDGASRGNPGEAGAGFWLHDGQGQRIAQVSRYVGVSTNNVAEYMALIWGLEEAKRLGVRDITIKTDSELVVRQVQGIYRVRHDNLIPLFNRTMGILNGFQHWEILHIPRALNKEADKLANQAIDGSSSL